MRDSLEDGVEPGEPGSVDVRRGQGVVVGNYNTVFQNFLRAPRDLSEHIRTDRFQALVDYRTREFTGRAFALEKIQRLLGDPRFPSGYVVVQGEPGVGKSALLSELVLRAGYVHHFNIATMNVTSVEAFLRNVCAQLIVRYGLTQTHAALPDDVAHDGGFLLGLLTEVASDPSNWPVVVVVDALDEADDPAAGRNPHYLPPVLPDGVFVIASTRPRDDHPLQVARLELIDLDAAQEARDDVSAYIRNRLAAGGEFLRARVSRWAASDERFVEELAARADGNFMYLVHVLEDIERGRLTPDNIGRVADFPQGLTAYYKIHWKAMRSQDQDRFLRFEEPVLCLLGTFKEPASFRQVTTWVGQYWTAKGWDPRALDRTAVRDVVRDWREFLNLLPGRGEDRYALYHRSFRDFLDHEVGLTEYTKTITDVLEAKTRRFPRRR